MAHPYLHVRTAGLRSQRFAAPLWRLVGASALLIPSLFSTPVVAAENSAQDFADMPLQELMSLDVFQAASMLPTRHDKAPGTVYSFTREDFTRLGVRRLDDLLRFVPGIQMNQYRKRHQSIWSRGLIDRYNDKLVLLVDGVRMQHLYYGHFSLGDNFPLEKIDKVEIIQGPASSLYGANAFGGIISITTRAFASGPETEATLEAAGNQRGKVTALYNSDTFQAFGSYLEQEAPFREDRLSFIGGETKQPLDETYRNVTLKARPVEGLTLMADYREDDTPFLFIPDTQDAFVEERMLSLAARYEVGDVESGRIEASLSYTRDDWHEYEKEQVTQTLGYDENQMSVMGGARITGFKRVHADHILALGASWQHERATDTDYIRYFHFADGFLSPQRTGDLLSEPEISNDDYSVYVQDVWEINPELTLTLGGRYDTFEVFGDYFNYRGALVYAPDARQSWKLLYGTAIRTPSFREYLKVLEGTTFEAPPLDPERIHSLELGYFRQWNRANLGVTLFHNQIEDYIHEVPTPDGADEYFANCEERWVMHGAEALLRYHMTDRVNLRLGAAYLNAEVENVGSLPYLAEWSSSLGVDYNYLRDHRLGLSLFYNSTRSDTNSYAEDDPGEFMIADLFASGPLSKQLAYRVGIDNLLDEQVYDPAADFGGQYNTEKSEREIWLQLQWSPSR